MSVFGSRTRTVTIFEVEIEEQLASEFSYSYARYVHIKTFAGTFTFGKGWWRNPRWGFGYEKPDFNAYASSDGEYLYERYKRHPEEFK